MGGGEGEASGMTKGLVNLVGRKGHGAGNASRPLGSFVSYQ